MSGEPIGIPGTLRPFPMAIYQGTDVILIKLWYTT